MRNSILKYWCICCGKLNRHRCCVRRCLEKISSQWDCAFSLAILFNVVAVPIQSLFTDDKISPWNHSETCEGVVIMLVRTNQIRAACFVPIWPYALRFFIRRQIWLILRNVLSSKRKLLEKQNTASLSVDRCS